MYETEAQTGPLMRLRLILGATETHPGDVFMGLGLGVHGTEAHESVGRRLGAGWARLLIVYARPRLPYARFVGVVWMGRGKLPLNVACSLATGRICGTGR